MSNNIERFVNRHIEENNSEQLTKDSIVLYDETIINLDLLENDKFFNFFENDEGETNKSLTKLMHKVKEQPKETSNSTLKGLINKIQSQNNIEREIIIEKQPVIKQENEQENEHVSPKPNKALSVNLVNKFFNSNIVKINKEDDRNIKKSNEKDITHTKIDSPKYIPPVGPKKIELSNRIKRLSVISNQPEISRPRVHRKYEDVRSSSKQQHLHYMLGKQRLKMLMSDSISDSNEKDISRTSFDSEEKYISIGTSHHKGGIDKKKFINTIIKDNFDQK